MTDTTVDTLKQQEASMAQLSGEEREAIVNVMLEARYFAPPDFDPIDWLDVDIDRAAAGVGSSLPADYDDSEHITAQGRRVANDLEGVQDCDEKRMAAMLIVGELAMRGRPDIACWLSQSSDALHVHRGVKHRRLVPADMTAERIAKTEALKARLTALRIEARKADKQLAAATKFLPGWVAVQLDDLPVASDRARVREKAEREALELELEKATAAAEVKRAEADEAAERANAQLQRGLDLERMRMSQRAAGRSSVEAGRLSDAAAQADESVERVKQLLAEHSSGGQR